MWKKPWGCGNRALQVTEVDAKPDPNDTSRLLICITYKVKATHDQRSLVYPFYLIPEE